jgi:hypothetical protein
LVFNVLINACKVINVSRSEGLLTAACAERSRGIITIWDCWNVTELVLLLLNIVDVSEVGSKALSAPSTRFFALATRPVVNDKGLFIVTRVTLNIASKVWSGIVEWVAGAARCTLCTITRLTNVEPVFSRNVSSLTFASLAPGVAVLASEESLLPINQSVA